MTPEGSKLCYRCTLIELDGTSASISDCVGELVNSSGCEASDESGSPSEWTVTELLKGAATALGKLGSPAAGVDSCEPEGHVWIG